MLKGDVMELLYEQLNGRDGHKVGRQLLETLYGGPLPEIAYTALGKPYFAGSSLHFSISHTPNHAFCVLSEPSSAPRARWLSAFLAPPVLLTR